MSPSYSNSLHYLLNSTIIWCYLFLILLTQFFSLLGIWNTASIHTLVHTTDTFWCRPCPSSILFMVRLDNTRHFECRSTTKYSRHQSFHAEITTYNSLINLSICKDAYLICKYLPIQMIQKANLLTSYKYQYS